MGSANTTDPSGKKETHLQALDELFGATKRYRSSEHYLGLMRFITRLPKYSPFNCFLLHVQNPKVRYVATARRWWDRFERTVKRDACPLVILAPRSPVAFVFDVADTEGPPLPENLLNPFAAKGQVPRTRWNRTRENLYRDRICLVEKAMPLDKAGQIGPAGHGDMVYHNDDFMAAHYRMTINADHDPAAKYATLVHELGHLYAGHLGTPDKRWWPDRRGMSLQQIEFEAESISYLVCSRAGIQSPSDAYLSAYLNAHDEIPDISLDIVIRVTNRIEEMGRRKLWPRKTED